MQINKNHYFVWFLFTICLFDFVLAVSKENSENNFARSSNGQKSAGYNASKPATKKSRLTATLIIIYILAVIFTGIFIYYFCMCYPILCRKERNYDVVEHSRDTTPTPNLEKIP